jgi:hypothetical protein
VVDDRLVKFFKGVVGGWGKIFENRIGKMVEFPEFVDGVL